MKTERLTLRVWPLNAARILDRLINRVYEHGGYLVDKWPFVKGTDVYEVKDEFVPGTITHYLRCLSYISFVLNGTYYYVQLGDNPFMGLMFAKEATDGETITAAQAGMELPLAPWFEGEEYSYLYGNEVERNAQRLFEYLTTSAPFTQSIPGKDKVKIRKKEQGGN